MEMLEAIAFLSIIAGIAVIEYRLSRLYANVRQLQKAVQMLDRRLLHHDHSH